MTVQIRLEENTQINVKVNMSFFHQTSEHHTQQETLNIIAGQMQYSYFSLDKHASKVCLSEMSFCHCI